MEKKGKKTVMYISVDASNAYLIVSYILFEDDLYKTMEPAKCHQDRK